MSTRPSQTAQDTLDDARNVLAAARKHRVAIEAADKARKLKALPKARLDALAATIAQANEAKATVTTTKIAVAGATAAERKAREEVLERITAIRAEIKLVFPDDKALGRAFAVGSKLGLVSKTLLETADAVIHAYRDTDAPYGKQAKDAGITPARITALDKARRALDAADAVQGDKIGVRKGSASDKAKHLATIKKEVAHIRKVAQSVFASDPKVLAAFTSTIARRTVKKRPAKTV